MPGLMMPGTPLLGSKYFQEMAPDPDPDAEEPDHAVDRGQIEEMGLSWPLEPTTISDADLAWPDLKPS